MDGVIVPRRSTSRFIEDVNCLKLVTILFLNHRVQAKLYKTDTLVSFVDRVSFEIECLIFNIVTTSSFRDQSVPTNWSLSSLWVTGPNWFWQRKLGDEAVLQTTYLQLELWAASWLQMHDNQYGQSRHHLTDRSSWRRSTLSGCLHWWNEYTFWKQSWASQKQNESRRGKGQRDRVSWLDIDWQNVL